MLRTFLRTIFYVTPQRAGYIQPKQDIFMGHQCDLSNAPNVDHFPVNLRSFTYGVPFVHLIFRIPNGHLCAKRQKMADFLRTIAHLVRGIQLSFSRVSRTHSLCVRISTSILRTYRPLVCACFHGLIWAECTFVIPLFLCTG